MQVKNINFFNEGSTYYEVDLKEFTVNKVKINSVAIATSTINFSYCGKDVQRTMTFAGFPLELFFTEAGEAYNYCKDYLESKIRKQRINLSGLELCYSKLNDSYLDLKFKDTYYPRVEY